MNDWGGGLNGWEEEKRPPPKDGRFSLSHLPLHQCPRRDSNSQGIAPGGF